MKKFSGLISAVLLLLSVNSVSQQYWIRQASPTNRQLIRCSFSDSLYGWVSGDLGIIINTTNGGVNWNIQSSGTPANVIEDVHFINRRFGWAVSNNSLTTRTTILRTTNGGLNWLSAPFPDTTVYSNAIHFLDSLRGFVAGATGEIFRTTNGGINWTRCYIDTNGCSYGFPKKDLCFINSSTGFASGGIFDIQGVVWKTTDGGFNWSTYCIPSEPLFRIKYINGNRLAGMGGDYKFGATAYRTSNLGNSWTFESTNTFGLPTGFSFRTPSEVWACLSFSGYWAVNTDSMRPGSPWTSIPVPDSSGIYDVEFLSPTLGWAFGYYGSIYKYNPNIIGISNSQNETPVSFRLEQNYPNPFNPISKIKYQIAKLGKVNLVIFDLLGNKIQMLVNAFQNAGTYEVNFDGTNLASGVYYYQLIVNSEQLTEYRETKKMVLMK